MKVKQVDKHYLYLRDGQNCYYCGRKLMYGKVSLDHYLPRSAGGTDDVFNLVTSCKKCNGGKRNDIPTDVEKKHLEGFIQGVAAGKILGASVLKIGHNELADRCKLVKKAYASGGFTLFESDTERFFVKDNTICQITQLRQTQLLMD